MNREQLRALAQGALYQAQSIRDAANGNIPADQMEAFNRHMADFATHSNALKALTAQEEQFAALDAGLEEFAAPQASPLQNQAPTQTPEQRAEAAKREHAHAFVQYLQRGERSLPMQLHSKYIGGVSKEELELAGADPEVWAHVGTVDSLGGFLVPEDFMNELIKDLAGATIMRRICKVRQTSRSVASFLSLVGSGNRQYTSGLTGSFRSEGWNQGGAAMPVQNQPRFGRERVPVYIWSPDVIEITMELLEDAGLNLEAEIRELLVETRGQDEESVFVLGTGVGMPTGIHTEAAAGNIPTVISGNGTALTYDGLVNAFTALPSQYRSSATWLMNSATMGAIMLLKDNDNRPLYPVNSLVENLFGRPVEITEFMPDVAASAIPIIFGDFKRGYGIADRMDMRIIRLDERYAPNKGIMAVARVGGQMVRSQPFVSQTVSA